MSENITLPGSGSVVATDDCTINTVAVQVQRVKAGWGADSAYNDAQVALPLPVQNTFESSQVTMLGVVVTPQYAPIDVNTSGDNVIVPSVAGKVIRVLSYEIVVDGSVVAKWWNGPSATGTKLSGGMSFSASGGISADYNPAGHFQTGTATNLVLNLSGAVGARGHLTYIAG